MNPSPSPSDPESAPEPLPIAPATPPVDLVAPEPPSGPPPAAVTPPATTVRRDHRLVWTTVIAGAAFFLGLGVGLAVDRPGGGGSDPHALEAAKEECASGSSDVRIGDEGATLVIDRAGAEEMPGATLSQLDCLLGELDVPDSVVERIQNTRALDGYQEADFDGYTASWTFHPDDGLNLTITTA
ncbi:hypothetical protein [Glycomyces paridis]|uniref:Uncharacterized protein n=1 Tax=Glycomyces paridis TaxID=2126555 RepID=A0A4S8P4S8_9ACTN|nr:hypothetical protein [Glycomyces paridis]THV22824.1 hypothetical protein E9998_23305 [Glycomyces paridis]